MKILLKVDFKEEIKTICKKLWTINEQNDNWKQGGSELRKKRTKNGMKHQEKTKTIRRYSTRRQGRGSRWIHITIKKNCRGEFEQTEKAGRITHVRRLNR